MHLDQVDLMVGGVPFEWLKKGQQKKVCSQLLRDEQQKIHELVTVSPADTAANAKQPGAAATKIELLVGLLAATKENPNFLKVNGDFLAQALPFFLSYPSEDEGDKSLAESKRLKILTKTVDAQEFFRCFQIYRGRVWRILNRTSPFTDEKSVLSNIKNEEASIDTELKRDIEYAGKQLVDYFNWENIKKVREVESRDAIRKLYLQDVWLYPLIPALYSLDILTIALEGSRVAKSDLVQPDQDRLDDWSSTSHDLGVKVKGATDLYSLISERCSDKFSLYITAAYPRYPKKPPSRQLIGMFFGNQVEYDDPYWDETNEGKDTAPFFRRSSVIKLPICRYRRLVFDIAKMYDLPNAELLDLLHKVPNCLYNGTPEWNQLAVSQVDNVVAVLRVFRKLSEPDFYMQDKSVRMRTWKGLKKSLEKARFSYEGERSDTDGLILLKRYFYFQDVSELLFFMCAPISLEYGPLPKLPALFKTVQDELREVAEDWYFKQKNRLNSDTENIPAHIRQFRRAVCQTITVNDAVIFLKGCLSFSSGSDSYFRKRCQAVTKEFLSKKSNDYQQEVLNSVTGDVENLIYFYFGLLRTSLDLACSAGIGILLRLFLFEHDRQP